MTKGGPAFDCVKCASTEIPVAMPDGTVRRMLQPELWGCIEEPFSIDGRPVYPVGLLMEDGTEIQRCPKAILRDTEWWQEFEEAWWWKREGGGWPVAGGWMEQSAIFLDAYKLMEMEIRRYGPRQGRHGRNGSNEGPAQ